MAPTDYNETVEARRFVRGASQFYTAEEQAVFDALQADFVRQKSRFGLRMPNRREHWEQELAAVADFLPLDHPMIADALADGDTAFRDRVADRIWAQHSAEFSIPRCPECDRILKTDRAQQCLWCGHDWH